MDDEQFLNDIFQKLLYREPTSNEIEFHLSTLTDRQSKADEFLSCYERLANHTQVISQIGPTKLKVAVMLVGHFRRFPGSKNCWEQFKSNHPHVDFFIHTWNEIGERDWDSWIEVNGPIPNFEEIHQTLKPISILREDHTKFLESFGLYNKISKDQKLYLAAGQRVKNHRDFSKFIMSQLYSIYTCHKLVRNYEILHNFRYDVIIKLRADTIFFHPLYFDKLQFADNILYIHSRAHHHADGGKGCLTCDKEYPNRQHEEHTNDVCDVLLYGNSVIMEKYCNLYLHIEGFLDQLDKDNQDIIKKYPEHFKDNLSNDENIVYLGQITDYDKNLKLFYPERLIREYFKDCWLLSDPLCL
jgi:hypothetical protein